MVAHTNASGRLQLRKTGSCVTVAVHAIGFLERRTCSSSEVTLWPVADAQERETTRTAAFRHDQLRAEWWSIPFDVTFATELRARPDVQETWVAAAYEVAQLTGGRISFRFVESVGEGYIIAPASFPTVCSDGPRWPIETGGFCTEQTSGYFVDQINVLPGRLTDRSVALRALLSVVGGIIPHSLPGLMNTSRPDSELSAFERKTLHMIGLRRTRQRRRGPISTRSLSKVRRRVARTRTRQGDAWNGSRRIHSLPWLLPMSRCSSGPGRMAMPPRSSSSFRSCTASCTGSRGTAWRPSAPDTACSRRRCSTRPTFGLIGGAHVDWRIGRTSLRRRRD